MATKSFIVLFERDSKKINRILLQNLYLGSEFEVVLRRSYKTERQVALKIFTNNNFR